MDFDGSWNGALERIVREAIAEDRSPRARTLAAAEWVAQDPGRALDVGAMAARAAMSPRSLERWLLRSLGLTPSRFIAAARLAAARRLLERTTLPVKAIAQRCGYGHPERMRRAFQRALAASPTRYAAARGSVPPNA